jgi:propane monooxygenase small subunit
VSLNAAQQLQPIWSEVSEKVVRFEDSLDASKGRLTDLLADITLETPKEVRS